MIAKADSVKGCPCIIASPLRLPLSPACPCSPGPESASLLASRGLDEGSFQDDQEKVQCTLEAEHSNLFRAR